MTTRDPGSSSPAGDNGFYVDPPGVRAAAAHLDEAGNLLRQIGTKLAVLRPTSPGYDPVSMKAGQDILAVVKSLQNVVYSAEQRADNLANSVRLFVERYEQTDQDGQWPLNGHDT